MLLPEIKISKLLVNLKELNFLITDAFIVVVVVIEFDDNDLFSLIINDLFI